MDRQRSYYDQTVSYIIPLAAGEPWFAAWYSDWQTAHADLAGPGPASPVGSGPSRAGEQAQRAGEGR